MTGNENLLAYLVGKDDGPEAERYRQARDSFWEYCRQMNPAFFREDRPHLRELAETLQALEEGTLKAPDGSVCRPPGHLRAAAAREELHHDAVQPVVLRAQPPTGSSTYPTTNCCRGRFSKGVRDGIDATKIDPELHRLFRYFPRCAHQVRGCCGAAVEPGGQLFFLPGCGHGRHHYPAWGAGS